MNDWKNALGTGPFVPVEHLEGVSGVLQIVIATVFGLISGYWGGKFDLILQRIVDAIMCFPWLFLTLTIMALLGPGMVQLIIVIGFQWGIANIRTMRGVVLSVKESEYVTAARGWVVLPGVFSSYTSCPNSMRRS